jgi:5'-nucleotidase
MLDRTLKILLTNDDGIDASGIQALFNSVTHAIRLHLPGQAHEIVVVAPDRCRSECSHSIETSRPLTLKTIRPNWYSVDGTPVDCIRVSHYAMDYCPDVVFSGINAGANLGVNLTISGTFAAAREASMIGIPALAVSHYRHPDVPRTWDHTPAWLAETFGQFLAATIDHHVAGRVADQTGRADCSGGSPLWNVNLPAVHPDSDALPERSVCGVDRCPIDRKGAIEGAGRIRFELDFHARPREQGRDVEQCFGGRITISKFRSPFLDD